MNNFNISLKSSLSDCQHNDSFQVLKYDIKWAVVHSIIFHLDSQWEVKLGRDPGYIVAMQINLETIRFRIELYKIQLSQPKGTPE